MFENICLKQVLNILFKTTCFKNPDKNKSKVIFSKYKITERTTIINGTILNNFIRIKDIVHYVKLRLWINFLLRYMHMLTLPFWIMAADFNNNREPVLDCFVWLYSCSVKVNKDNDGLPKPACFKTFNLWFIDSVKSFV